MEAVDFLTDEISEFSSEVTKAVGQIGYGLPDLQSTTTQVAMAGFNYTAAYGVSFMSLLLGTVEGAVKGTANIVNTGARIAITGVASLVSSLLPTLPILLLVGAVVLGLKVFSGGMK